jgi:hypothetical protein
VDTQVNVQNRPVLYEKAEPVLVPEGLYEVTLVEIRRFRKDAAVDGVLSKNSSDDITPLRGSRS